jgi:chromosome segregation ATPase
MSDFREMPFVTVEQIVRMREAAMLECAQLSQQTWKQDEEIDRLRAEVASLKEERDKMAVELLDKSLALEQVTQQLAAANGRVEMLRGTIAEVCEGYTLHDGARKQLETALWDALSNLNEDRDRNAE